MRTRKHKSNFRSKVRSYWSYPGVLSSEYKRDSNRRRSAIAGKRLSKITKSWSRIDSRVGTRVCPFN